MGRTRVPGLGLVLGLVLVLVLGLAAPQLLRALAGCQYAASLQMVRAAPKASAAHRSICVGRLQWT
eukprot:gene4647-4900_t